MRAWLAGHRAKDGAQETAPAALGPAPCAARSDQLFVERFELPGGGVPPVALFREPSRGLPQAGAEPSVVEDSPHGSREILRGVCEQNVLLVRDVQPLGAE